MARTKAKQNPGPSRPANEDPIFQTIEEQLPFSQETILQDAANQPLLFLKAIEHRVQCLREFLRAKVELDAIEAEAGMRAREALTELEEKITEKRVEELVKKDPERMAAVEKRLEAEAREEGSKLIVEVFRHRRDCLKLVGEMVSSEVSLQSALEAGNSRMADARRRARSRFSSSS